jgi:hypothetical protein
MTDDGTTEWPLRAQFVRDYFVPRHHDASPTGPATISASSPRAPPSLLRIRMLLLLPLYDHTDAKAARAFESIRSSARPTSPTAAAAATNASAPAAYSGSLIASVLQPAPAAASNRAGHGAMQQLTRVLAHAPGSPALLLYQRRLDDARSLLHSTYVQEVGWVPGADNASAIRAALSVPLRGCTSRAILVDRYDYACHWALGYDVTQADAQQQPLVFCMRLCARDAAGRFEAQHYPSFPAAVGERLRPALLPRAVEMTRLASHASYRSLGLDLLGFHFLWAYCLRHGAAVHTSVSHAKYVALFADIDFGDQRHDWKYDAQDPAACHSYIARAEDGTLGAAFNKLASRIEALFQTKLHCSDILGPSGTDADVLSARHGPEPAAAAPRKAQARL